MVKEVRVTEEDAFEAQFQTEGSGLRHLGTGGTRWAWSEQPSGPGKATGSQGNRKRRILPTAQGSAQRKLQLQTREQR